MKKTLCLLPFSVLITAPIHTMNPTKTLVNAATHLARLLVCCPAKAELNKLQNWYDIKNTPHAVKNHVLQTMILTDYSSYRSKVQQLVAAGGDPNAADQLPLAIALHHNDLNFTTFLLENYANPNQFVNPRSIDINDHQETGSNVNLNQLENKPAFYFAKNVELAQLCKDFDADASIKYCSHMHSSIPSYGNVLTHIFDDSNYAADLTKFYLENGAGPYCISDTSDNGSTLHHIIFTLEKCSTDSDIKRLLICTAYLLNKEPNLLKSKDIFGRTPSNYLNALILPKDKADIRKQFLQLFEAYQTTTDIKTIRE